MKAKGFKKKISALLAGIMVLTAIPMASVPVKADEPMKDAAIYATITSDYTSDWENLEGVINKDFEPTSSNQGNAQGWGNWSQDVGSSHYLELNWAEAIKTSSFDVFWYDDGGGLQVPATLSFQYKDTDGNWQELTMQSKFEDVIAKDQYNRIEVTEVTTKGIRMNMTVKEGAAGNGVYRWKVYTDEIPQSIIPDEPDPEEPSEDLKLPDVGVYAIPSADYTSEWENLNGINDASFEPTGSSIGTGKGWGNWPQEPGSEHWVQYDWDEAVTTKTFQVYWYGDNGGMKLPGDVRFEYKDADGNWQKATLVSDKRNFLKFGKYNQITIEEVTTKAIRMYVTVGTGGDCCGIYRWKVYSDVTDEFVVSAAGNSLVIPEVIDGKIASRIRKSITLPQTAMNGTVNVAWESDNKAVISDDGKITPPAKDTVVTMTATCSMGDVVKQKEIKITVLSDHTTEYALTVDPQNEGVDISQELFGVFYEDINSAADGGLSTELIKNNSFENYQNLDSATAPEVFGDQTSWKLHWNSTNASNFVVERTDGLNENNKNYAKITGNMQLSNHGFVEKAKLDKSAIAITEGKEYAFSMFMKADSAYAGEVKVKVVDDAGSALTNEITLGLKKDGTWQKVTGSLTGTTTKLGTLVLTFANAADTDAMFIDMVSLIPTDSYGYGDKNYSYGAGLRKDLVEKLQVLNPSFIRFPGGCVIEGSYGTDNYYNWEDSIGPLEERRAIGSYWGTIGHPVNYTENYGYMMSYQFGYHEILTLCEDLGAQAFPILSAGIFCQFRDTAEAVTGDDLEKFAKHATNLIDYCWGDPDSTDETQAYWASKRVANGHEKNFDLNYIGIGNENWGETYYANYAWIKDYVEKYVAEHYPDKTITLISSTGPYYQGSQQTEAWNWINTKMPGETLVDEHYYINYAGDGNNTLLNDDYVYDKYKRLKDGGSNVFIGEYAGHLTSTTENVLDTAISEAAFMTGIERNGDIVRHASYAPLFEREGCRDWDYNLIKFDAYNSYGTPSYYVQTMYSNNYGKKIINTTLQKYNAEKSAFEEFGGHQKELYYVSSKDDDYIYLKLVNHDSFSKEITLNYPGIKDGVEVELISLSGDSMDMNTMDEPTKVAPESTKTVLKNQTMTYEVPAMSLTVVKVPYIYVTADQAAADAAVAKINAIGTVALTDAGKAAIDAARAAYNALTAEQKALVTAEQLKVLTAAEAKYAELVAAAAAKKPLATGTKATGGVGEYTVTNAAAESPEVSFIPSATPDATSAVVPATVKIDGIVYKVTKIEPYAYEGFTELKKITIPGTVTEIGDHAFEACESLKTIKLPADLTVIGNYAFSECEVLKSVTIPLKVTTIGKQAFEKCPKLKTITIKSTVLKKVGKKAFKGINAKATIKVPKKQKKAYQKLLKNKGQTKNVKIK